MPNRQNRHLRRGFTTGTAAAAATKAAMLCLVNGQVPENVRVDLPGGDALQVKVQACTRSGPNAAVCTVIKDISE